MHIIKDSKFNTNLITDYFAFLQHIKSSKNLNNSIIVQYIVFHKNVSTCTKENVSFTSKRCFDETKFDHATYNHFYDKPLTFIYCGKSTRQAASQLKRLRDAYC